jgi:hypothetical protein
MNPHVSVNNPLYNYLNVSSTVLLGTGGFLDGITFQHATLAALIGHQNSLSGGFVVFPQVTVEVLVKHDANPSVQHNGHQQWQDVEEKQIRQKKVDVLVTVEPKLAPLQVWVAGMFNGLRQSQAQPRTRVQNGKKPGSTDNFNGSIKGTNFLRPQGMTNA